MEVVGILENSLLGQSPHLPAAVRIGRWYHCSPKHHLLPVPDSPEVYTSWVWGWPSAPRWDQCVVWFMLLQSPRDQAGASLQLGPHPCLVFPTTQSCFPLPFSPEKILIINHLLRDFISVSASKEPNFRWRSQQMGFKDGVLVLDHCLARWWQAECW